MNIEVLKNNGVNVERSLSLLGDMSLYNETITTFINESEEKLKNIVRYKEANDMINYSILVHSLKSEANYLGFDLLANMAFNHEKASKLNDTNFVYQNFNELINEFNRIILVSKQYIGSSVDVLNEQSSLKGKILVVDDSNIIRNFVKKIFNNEYEVLEATNGNEAIEVVKNTDDVACMLLDLNMPDCNGFEVLEHFKANNLFKKVPVSLLTGDDAKESIQNAFKYPIVDMVSKPFNESDVKAIVEKMITIHNFN